MKSKLEQLAYLKLYKLQASLSCPLIMELDIYFH